MRNWIHIIIGLLVSISIEAQETTKPIPTKQKEQDRLGVFGVTYNSKSDLGMVAEAAIDKYYIVGMQFSMNLDSYQGIGQELRYATVTEYGKLGSTPEYKQMSIAFLGGLQLNKTFAIIAALGYTNKTEYYRLDTNYGYSKVAYNYHVETGVVYGEIYAGLKLRMQLSNFLAVSLGVGTNAPEFGLYYCF